MHKIYNTINDRVHHYRATSAKEAMYNHRYFLSLKDKEAERLPIIETKGGYMLEINSGEVYWVKDL